MTEKIKPGDIVEESDHAAIIPFEEMVRVHCEKPNIRQVAIRCPWHGEKTPSLILEVTEDQQGEMVSAEWLCFGCGRKGSAALVQREETEEYGFRLEWTGMLEAALNS